ncbi:hypothetical protein J2X06_002610 [Lysobacter niastensis]|uniref:Alpha-galactosidase NEW3 domain-containing protein n=1 Tax=Lysobacter niastensis TaxID=380629 RepID=A0ABU1WCM4_9GAMM|nr:choice-of-anchor Q domain-containing protein [Lysobacter niastensis]MDR7135401.1 hypothetical protein [Lysobacter niastensis]
MSLVSRRALTQSILSLLIVPAGFAIGSAQAATNFYVRTDGGDATQCNGRADAPYSGSGTAQNCAWKHPYYALPSSGTARIAGGDTLMIGSGEYMIGYGAPGMAGTCASGDRSACALGKIPSGTASAPTRILGNGTTAPKLWGAERTNSVLNLVGSNNVEVGYLEITDKSNCISSHSTASAACNKTSAPYGNWARAGIQASASSNVWLHDLNIHGLAGYAMNAGGLSNWTMERVKMNANGWAGWDGNVGESSSSNSGQMILRQVEIAWNGCAENWQTGEKINCWAQKAGGYGDGMGTYYTGGQWLIEDSDVHHNVSDGVDLLYLDGAAGTTLTVRRLHSYANAGNQLKTNGNATIENSVLDGYCSYFSGKDYMQAGDMCRANGNALSISMKDGNVVNVRHNTIISEGQGAIMSTGGTASAKLTIQNNAIIGKPYYLAPSALSIGHIVYNSTATVSYSGNLFWNVKNGQCPSGSVCQDPKLANMSLSAFDAEPLAGSPVIDKVPVISGVTTDFVMAPRPSGAQADIGAYEVQMGGTTPPPAPAPAPVCTHAAPTVSLSGNTAAVAAGTAITYTVNVRNNDSASCANTSFALARTVPTGWTGTLSTSSVALAPGASGSATLQVTSPASAAARAYGIGTGVSSVAGSTHTASASTIYTVAAPVAPAPATLTETLTPSQSVYNAGTKVSMTARVLKAGLPVRGASVRFEAVKPNGIDKIVGTVTTDASGYAKWSFVSGTGSSSIGTYKANAVTTSGTATAAASATFQVK